MDVLVSIREAAKHLSCSEAAIRKWLHQGRLQCVKVGRLTRIRKLDLEALIRLGLDEQSLSKRTGS